MLNSKKKNHSLNVHNNHDDGSQRKKNIFQTSKQINFNFHSDNNEPVTKAYTQKHGCEKKQKKKNEKFTYFVLISIQILQMKLWNISCADNTRTREKEKNNTVYAYIHHVVIQLTSLYVIDSNTISTDGYVHVDVLYFFLFSFSLPKLQHIEHIIQIYGNT